MKMKKRYMIFTMLCLFVVTSLFFLDANDKEILEFDAETIGKINLTKQTETAWKNGYEIIDRNKIEQVAELLNALQIEKTAYLQGGVPPIESEEILYDVTLDYKNMETAVKAKSTYYIMFLEDGHIIGFCYSESKDCIWKLQIKEQPQQQVKESFEGLLVEMGEPSSFVGIHQYIIKES